MVIQNGFMFIAFLLFVAGALLALQKYTKWKIFDYVPPLVWIYVLNMIFCTLGLFKSEACDAAYSGLKNNLLLFNVVKKVGMDLFGFLEKIKPGALRANSPQGYVIRALKRHLKEYYGVDETSEGFVLKG